MKLAYQYVVLRCVPRPDREEFVNVGVVLFCEERKFLDVACRVDTDRLAALDGRLDPVRLRELGAQEAQAQLRTISGIGPFWASAIYLRGCGIVDEFPDEPLAIAALGRLHGLGDRPDPETLKRITDKHRPYRMWVGVLLRVAAARGVIPGIAGRERRIRDAAR